MLRSNAGRGATGPSASAEWTTRAIPGMRAPLRAMPDAGNEAGPGVPVYHVLREPSIVRDLATGLPLFSLTLILRRQPHLGENSIENSVETLVSGGICAMTMSVVPSPAELAALNATATGDYKAIFPHQTTWALQRKGAPKPLAPLAVVSNAGASGRGTFALTLDREGALATLGAMRGQDTGLVVTCEVVFRAVTPEAPQMKIAVDLARVYDEVARHVGPIGLISEGDLLDSLVRMWQVDAIKVKQAEGSVSLSPVDRVRTLMPDLMRALAPILRRADGGLESQPIEYQLRQRPADQAQMTFQRQSGAAMVERSALVSSPLCAVVADMVNESGLDALVHLVCPGSDGALHPVARRLLATRARPLAESRGSPLALAGSVAAAMPAVLKTDSAAHMSAQALVASDLVVRPTLNRPHLAWALDDLIVDRLDLGLGPGVARPQRLPVIEDESPLWRDRVDAGSYWYAPELALVAPATTDTASVSPFLFSFRTVGHDAEGRPGLEATVRVTFRQQIPAATQSTWEAHGKPPLQAVPLGGLSASLEIPLRDEFGRSLVQTVNAVKLATEGERTVATFELTDKWARLCYGAMSTPGFQQHPVRLVASYVFAAYVPVDRDAHVGWGGKQALTEVAAAPVSEDGATSGRPAAALMHATAIVGHTAPMAVVHPLASVAIHPPLASSVDLAVWQRKTYGIRSQGRTSAFDVLAPCAEFGSLYVQTMDSMQTAIGCREAFALGQIQYQLYERLDIDLTDLGMPRPGLKVYRSLQAPGCFLVVPDAYTIARFEPGDSRAYRPAVYLFSSVDAVHPEQGRCILMASLQPAVPPFRRRQLLDLLRQQAHPNPTLEWPTDLGCAPIYDWAIADVGAGAGMGAGQIRAAAAKTPDGFQVSLTTPLAGALQLKAVVEQAGVNAMALFRLNDGTSLETALAIDLTRIEGPWTAGAVEVTRSGGSVTLTNRVEQAVDVSDLLLYVGGARSGVVAVERRLAAGESCTVEGVPPSDEALPRYASAGGVSSLEEVRTFIEDIYTNVVFKSSLDFAAKNIREVVVEARILGVEGTVTDHLSAASTVVELRFVLPLTVYLAQPTVQFHLTVTDASGAVTSGLWRDWRLDTLGNVIPVSSDLVTGG